MSQLNYDLFYGSQNYEWRLDRLFYEAYPNERQQGRQPLQYAIAVAIKVGQYLTNLNAQGKPHQIKTPDHIRQDLVKVVFAVLSADRSWQESMKSNPWLSERAEQLVELWIIQKLLVPELQSANLSKS